MKAKLLLFICFCTATFLRGQEVKTNLHQINFGTVMVGSTDSVQLVIHNFSDNALNISGFKFYTVYNAMPFYVKQNNLSIPFQGKDSIWIYFEPIQNILHNTEMIIQHTASSAYEPVDLIGQGRFPLTYYNSTENLSEEALKQALKTRLGQGYSQQSYSGARDFMFMSIDNKKTNGQGATVNTLECVYTGTQITGYANRSAAQTGSPQFNTEHTFPQGFFNQALPMRSDIHHLFPTTNTSNSTRGSKPFGVVSNGSAVGGGSFSNSTTFEPRNQQKGRTARAMMYFVIRYQDYANHFAGQENILRTWHNSFPVDSIDIRRNNDIAIIQNNRNPFIDYPQLEERINNFVSNSSAPLFFGLDVLQSSINFGNVIAQTVDTFNYVLVNRGNRDIIFSNYSLSNTTNFGFAPGSGNIDTLIPGEDIQMAILFYSNGLGTATGTLNFSTNIPGGQSNFAIPINANSIVVGIDEAHKNHASLFPNPTDGILNLKATDQPIESIQIIDILGKSHSVSLSRESNGLVKIGLNHLKSGVYFIRYQMDGKSYTEKIIRY